MHNIGEAFLCRKICMKLRPINRNRKVKQELLVGRKEQEGMTLQEIKVNRRRGVEGGY